MLFPLLLALQLHLTGLQDLSGVSPDDALCPPQLQLAHPEQCPALGPGVYAEQLAAARLPDPIPDVPL